MQTGNQMKNQSRGLFYRKDSNFGITMRICCGIVNNFSLILQSHPILFSAESIISANGILSPTSRTNHWQKAGEIHSLAWKPQSIKIAFLFTPGFPTYTRK